MVYIEQLWTAFVKEDGIQYSEEPSIDKTKSSHVIPCSRPHKRGAQLQLSALDLNIFPVQKDVVLSTAFKQCEF